MDYRVKNLLLIIIALSLVAAGFSAARRLIVEGQDKTVELAMDYDDIVTVSQIDGSRLGSLVRQLKDAGISSIALAEDTLDSAEKKGTLTWVSGADLLNVYRVTSKADPYFIHMLKRESINPLHYYIRFKTQALYKRVRDELSLTLSSSQVKELEGNILEVTDDELDLSFLGIGLPQDIYSYLKSQGFRVIPRLKNSYRLNSMNIARKLNMEGIAYDDDLMLFDEEEVMGYPYSIKVTASELLGRKMKYGFIEFAEQLGDISLARAMKEDTVRIHSIPQDEMEIMTEDNALSRWMRAVTERSVRLLYIHPFLKPSYDASITETNFSYLKRITDKLKAAGFEIGASKSQLGLHVTFTEVLLIDLGIISGLLILLSKFFRVPDWAVYLAVLLGAGLCFVFLGVGKVLLLRKLSAFVAAVTFPALAIISPVERLKLEILNRGAWQKVMTVVESFIICACGSMLLVGILSDTLFRIGAEQFSGVKLALILPVFLVALYFFLGDTFNATMKQLISLLSAPLSVWHVALVLILGIFGVLFILRSGNFGVAVPGFERHVRDLIEAALTVRPRTKEFLMGWPMLLLTLLYFKYIPKHWLWLPFSVSSIAVISVTNTFSHIHSPLLISIIRSVNGLVFGLLIGAIAYGCIELFRKFIARYQ